MYGKNIMKCQSTTHNGKKCLRNANNGYCWQHKNNKKGGGSLSIIPAPKKNEWTIYGKNYCGYTQRARQNLKSHKYYNIETKSSEEIKKFKKENNIPQSYNTVPMIFDNNGKFIGGYNDLKL